MLVHSYSLTAILLLQFTVLIYPCGKYSRRAGWASEAYQWLHAPAWIRSRWAVPPELRPGALIAELQRFVSIQRDNNASNNQLGSLLAQIFRAFPSERNETRMPQMAIRRPFGKLEPAHQQRLQPTALFHLGRR
jgi:hypothetical protein